MVTGAVILVVTVTSSWTGGARTGVPAGGTCTSLGKAGSSVVATLTEITGASRTGIAIAVHVVTRTTFRVRTCARSNPHSTRTTDTRVFTRSTRTRTPTSSYTGTSGTTTTLFVRAATTVSHGSTTTSATGGVIPRNTSTQTARVGQDGIVDVGTGAVDFTCRHEDVVADFVELDTVDFDLFAVGDGSNGGFGGVSGKG